MKELLDSIIELFKKIISYIGTNINAEDVALISVLVTIIIYILNRQAELKFKKYESKRM